MQKTFLIPILVIVVILTACNTPALTETPGAVPTAPTIIIPTLVPTESACTSLKLEPTPGPDMPSLFPSFSTGDHVRGAENAVVTILIYNDFQCNECNYLPISKQVLESHPNDVRIVYRHFPYTELFDKSEMAARATEAAAGQGKFWEMHDLLFEQQSAWIDMPADSFEIWVNTKVVELDLDQAQFNEDFNSAKTIERVRKAAEEGARIGIPKLPFYLINGQVYYGPASYEALDQVINLIKLGEQQFTSCPPMSIDPNVQYIATLETEKGKIILQLYADKAPMAVNSFVFLARSGWYDDITFHRVIPGFVAQSGDPSGTGQGNPGYMFNNEAHSTLNFDQPGLLGMANSGPDTNGSQFFITYAPAPDLNGKYTIFGKVISGLDVLEQLTPRNPQPGANLPRGDKLIRVSIEEK